MANIHINLLKRSGLWPPIQAQLSRTHRGPKWPQTPNKSLRIQDTPLTILTDFFLLL